MISDFKVGEVQPEAQFEKSVTIYYQCPGKSKWERPGKRKWESIVVVGDDIRYVIIEQDGVQVYDSRMDVPVDENEWAKAHKDYVAHYGG